jgi:hypothetical protein
MLEITSYGLTGMVAILLVVFCFACKDDPALRTDKHSSRSMDDAELRRPKGLKRCRWAADTDAGPRGPKTRGDLNGYTN